MAYDEGCTSFGLVRKIRRDWSDSDRAAIFYQQKYEEIKYVSFE
jgi:hypothetical protein